MINNMHDFNDAVAKLEPQLKAAAGSKSDSAVADLYLAASISGMAILPMDAPDHQTEPYMMMIYVPTGPNCKFGGVNAILVPANQVA